MADKCAIGKTCFLVQTHGSDVYNGTTNCPDVRRKARNQSLSKKYKPRLQGPLGVSALGKGHGGWGWAEEEGELGAKNKAVDSLGREAEASPLQKAWSLRRVSKTPLIGWGKEKDVCYNWARGTSQGRDIIGEQLIPTKATSWEVWIYTICLGS